MLPRTWTPEQLRDPKPLYESGLAELRGQINAAAPVVKNHEAVHSLSYQGTFLYRGVRYIARPVGYLAGVDLDALQLRAQELAGKPLTEEALRDAAAAFDRLAEIIHAHARPISLWRRLLRPLLGNPFRSMTEEEGATLHRFFSMCRKRSSVSLDVAYEESGRR